MLIGREEQRLGNRSLHAHKKSLKDDLYLASSIESDNQDPSKQVMAI